MRVATCTCLCKMHDNMTMQKCLYSYIAYGYVSKETKFLFKIFLENKPQTDLHENFLNFTKLASYIA